MLEIDKQTKGYVYSNDNIVLNQDSPNTGGMFVVLTDSIKRYLTEELKANRIDGAQFTETLSQLIPHALQSAVTYDIERGRAHNDFTLSLEKIRQDGAMFLLNLDLDKDKFKEDIRRFDENYKLEELKFEASKEQFLKNLEQDLLKHTQNLEHDMVKHNDRLEQDLIIHKDNMEHQENVLLQDFSKHSANLDHDEHKHKENLAQQLLIHKDNVKHQENVLAQDLTKHTKELNQALVIFTDTHEFEKKKHADLLALQREKMALEKALNDAQVNLVNSQTTAFAARHKKDLAKLILDVVTVGVAQEQMDILSGPNAVFEGLRPKDFIENAKWEKA